jgi:hypothetical protein
MVTKLLIKDLVLKSKIKEWAASNGRVEKLIFLRSTEDVPTALSDCSHLVLDLNLVEAQLSSLVALARASVPGIRITGFGAHVDKELHGAAKALGLDAVLPRSKFFSNLDKWLI